jgi:hypothetical protein
VGQPSTQVGPTLIFIMFLPLLVYLYHSFETDLQSRPFCLLYQVRTIMLLPLSPPLLLHSSAASPPAPLRPYSAIVVGSATQSTVVATSHYNPNSPTGLTNNLRHRGWVASLAIVPTPHHPPVRQPPPTIPLGPAHMKSLPTYTKLEPYIIMILMKLI